MTAPDQIQVHFITITTLVLLTYSQSLLITLLTYTMPARCIILPILLLLMTLASCTPRPSGSPALPWEYADLRHLSSSGDAPPDLDLIAAYTRTAGSDLQIRLDVLDLTFESTSDLYIALNTAPGGTRAMPIQATSTFKWDLLLILPAKGSPQAIIYDYTQSMIPTFLSYQFPNSTAPKNEATFPYSQKRSSVHPIPRIVRIPWLDTFIISLNRTTFPAAKFGFELQAFITPAGSSFPADSLGPFHSDNLPPGRAPLLLAFWNTFPAYTPAQAVRRWDGAHTGPFGERHGLHILLQAVRHSKVPVALLDLKTPTNLSALDYLGVIPKIQDLVEMGLIILPDTLPGSPTIPLFPAGFPDWAPARAAADSRQAAQAFGLPPSDMLFAPHLPTSPLPGYSLVFTPLDTLQPTRWRGKTLIPLPVPGGDQHATLEGLALEMRLVLLKTALFASEQPHHVPLLVLGGSLPDSAFGDPQAAEATLRYIAAHPWMQPLTVTDLHTLSPNSSAPLPPSSPAPRLPNYLNPLPPSCVTTLPPGSCKSGGAPLYLAAWQHTLALDSPLPPEPAQLPALRASYAGQVGLLLAAAKWAERPSPRADCLTDPDLDGQSECVLASDTFLAIFDDYGGRLLVMYTRTSDGVHQLIAPTSQFIVGLADPSTWDLSANDGADPGGIQGAFADSTPPWEHYQSTISSGSLTYTSPDRRLSKTFILSPHGLRVDYRSTHPLQIQIPIAIDPWERFGPGWSYRYSGEFTAAGWSWQLDGGPRIEVRTSGDLTANPFTESRPSLSRVEDPNFPYPRGHYLPFPIALVEIQSQEDFYVELLVSIDP